MKIIEVNEANLNDEHICCAISDKKGENRVALKKEWLRERFNDGLVFKKLDVRGKVFIEYIPAEKAFAPIKAPNYMYINCFWVSGKYKGRGYANDLLNECINDAKSRDMDGLAVLSSVKKMPFLSDPKYLKYKGFKLADKMDPYFELLYLPFNKESSVPSFIKNEINKEHTSGFIVYYTNQCPHSQMYVDKIKLKAKSINVPFVAKKIETVKQAKSSVTPFTTYSLFYNGKFITNEILTEKKFAKIINDLM